MLRLGGKYPVRMQPVVARALLAEWELARPNLERAELYGMRFLDPSGVELGGYFPSAQGLTFGTVDCLVETTADGIRVATSQFPPPIGFRSGPRAERSRYECYFSRLEWTADGWIGYRTAEMGGSGQAVQVELPPVPPATRWDFANTAGSPVVRTIETMQAPVLERLYDVVHALETACNDSLRYKRPLHFRID